MFCSVMPPLPSVSWGQEPSKDLQIREQTGRGNGWLIDPRLCGVTVFRVSLTGSVIAWPPRSFLEKKAFPASVRSRLAEPPPSKVQISSGLEILMSSKVTESVQSSHIGR